MLLPVEKIARFEEGVPADPTVNMSPEDAATWEEMNDKYEDQFKTASLDVAKTILDQMGGQRRLTLMIGAKKFVALNEPPGVSFQFMSTDEPSKTGNRIKVTLNALDIYDIEFGFVRGTSYRVVKEYSNVYADQLEPLFRRQTGLALRLASANLLPSEIARSRVVAASADVDAAKAAEKLLSDLRAGMRQKVDSDSVSYYLKEIRKIKDALDAQVGRSRGAPVLVDSDVVGDVDSKALWVGLRLAYLEGLSLLAKEDPAYRFRELANPKKISNLRKDIKNSMTVDELAGAVEVLFRAAVVLDAMAKARDRQVDFLIKWLKFYEENGRAPSFEERGGFGTRMARFPKGVEMTVDEVAAVVGPGFKEMNENPPPEVVRVREEMEGKTASVDLLPSEVAAYQKEAAASGLYGFTKGTQKDAESAIKKAQRKAASIAKMLYGKDERTVDFLKAHAKRANSKSAKLILAAMSTIGPRVASASNLSDSFGNRNAAKYEKTAGGLYGFPTKTARMALVACSDLRAYIGEVTYDLHSRRAAQYDHLTGFFKQHSKAARCHYASMMLDCYPDGPASQQKVASQDDMLRLAFVPDAEGGWLEWER